MRRGSLQRLGRRRSTDGRRRRRRWRGRGPSFADPRERRVVIVGPVADLRRGLRTAADDSARAAALGAGRADRVLVVEAARRGRQDAFAVAEGDAVALVRRTARRGGSARGRRGPGGGRSASATSGSADADSRASAGPPPRRREQRGGHRQRAARTGARRRPWRSRRSSVRSGRACPAVYCRRPVVQLERGEPHLRRRRQVRRAARAAAPARPAGPPTPGPTRDRRVSRP